jgi:site-specific recombinase XerD
MLYSAGVGLKRAQYLLGHASIQVTGDIYTHLEAMQADTETIDKMNYFFETGKKQN